MVAKYSFPQQLNYTNISKVKMRLPNFGKRLDLAWDGLINNEMELPNLVSIAAMSMT